MKKEGVNVAMEQVQMPAQTEVKKKPVKAVILGVLVLIAFLAIQMIISGIGAGVYMAACIAEAGGDTTLGTQMYMDKIANTGFMPALLVVTSMVGGIVAVLWYRFGIVKKYSREQWQELKQNVCNGKTITMFAVTAIGCYSMALLLAQLIAVLIPGSMETYHEVMGTALNGNSVLSFLAVVILAPIAEELAFRGIIFRILEKHCPIVAAIVIQAVLFGVYHMNIMQGLYVLPLALILGYTAYKTKSVLPCIFIHVINNLMPTLLSVLPENTPVVAVGAVMLFISAAVIYILVKGMKKQTA